MLVPSVDGDDYKSTDIKREKFQDIDRVIQLYVNSK
jgi:hypothetical protein